MRRSRFTKFTPLIAGLMTGLLFAILAVPLNAHPGDFPASYDISKEITLNGTVSSVLLRPAPGMTWGSHLMIETASGRVDASLGRWGLQGKDAVSVKPGQQIEVTGIMKSLSDKKEVFVARTVKVNGKLFTIRNQHGIEVSPQTRKRAAEKGESL
ncbi:exported hypothetical protein [Candidatus Sulfotelmatobacter kueseliae]|uniref:Magnetosome protein MamS/MamX domain-containing protein n=1 Tax=Candidatus Sulfotelmatobacter kueseliae TaxID=2042962 RepID=A0A2U3LDQ2_9BACT|nr:exported hypothetical protein [Candidatus Sulfotelmatobacter kueseliae]